MKAADIQSSDNNRADAIAKITMFCDRHGYSYKYTEKEFKITLPEIEVIPSPVDIPARRRPSTAGLDFLLPDPNGFHEDDQLPPATEPLTEGEPPKEDK